MTIDRRLALLPAALSVGLLLTGCSDADGGLKSTTADTTVKEAVTSIEVTGARRGSIDIKTGNGPGVTIHRTIHYRDSARPKPTEQVNDGVLTFTNGCDNCYIDYELTVPTSAKVKLSNSSGRITVAGVAAADIQTSSGDVRAEEISGPLKVETSSGSITGSGLSGPSADVRSSSGTAHLDFRKAPRSVTTDTGSGSMTLKVPGGTYKVAVATTSGKREVKVPNDPSATATLTAKASSGDVEITAV
ncbi:hypothetical protein AQI88_07740 [Streptomyces cellostaticus]|uniref:DUF4097 domain-containing protein n=2 Tax=Streptomyces cellostaticus TaxID=67285 RepID=A0A117PXW5_9ACTN|nr:hypothetical protein AQI88_07740 [Streptomyces cellostaticus]GHI04062.1 hypothetical protein Scel_23830 [Streptomyces cellostaticus]